MDALENSTVRILRADGKTVGTGFLVASNLVITCAHVIVDAKAIAGDTIQLQFTGREEILPGLVISDFWRDVGKEDVAFLCIEQTPTGIPPLRLGLAEISRPGDSFRSFGYATAADVNGIIANGTVDGYLRQHQLIQLQSPQANHGISGAPVFDDQRGVVIGMITKGHTELGRNTLTTFATPSELLFMICPQIKTTEKEPEDVFSQLQQLFNLYHMGYIIPEKCAFSAKILVGIKELADVVFREDQNLRYRVITPTSALIEKIQSFQHICQNPDDDVRELRMEIADDLKRLIVDMKFYWPSMPSYSKIPRDE